MKSLGYTFGFSAEDSGFRYWTTGSESQDFADKVEKAKKD